VEELWSTEVCTMRDLADDDDLDVSAS